MTSAFVGGRQADVYGLPLAIVVAALERKGYPGRRPDHGQTEYVDMLDGMGHEVPDAFRRISLDASRAFYDPAPLDVSVAERVNAGLRALWSIPWLALMPDSADTR